MKILKRILLINQFKKNLSVIQLYVREKQVTAVKSSRSNRGAFAVLPTGYGTSFIFQCFVSAKAQLETKTDTAISLCPCTLHRSFPVE